MKIPSRFLRFTFHVIASICCCGSVSGQQPGDSPLKIFILTGQSNMLGQGQISPASTSGTLEHLVVNDPNNDYQFLVTNDGEWVVRDDVWIRDQNQKLGGITIGYGSRTSVIGPELGFGHAVGDLHGNQVLIIKAAWGGKSLAVDFRPPSSGGETGFYYKQLIRLIDEATSNLSTYFPDYDAAGGYEFAGLCWHQGFNDRLSVPRSAEYEANMVNLIRDVRSELNVPNLPVVIATTGTGGLGSPTGDGGGTQYSDVELAQLAVANATLYPEFVGNVSVIDTRQSYNNLVFWLSPSSSPAPRSEEYHWNRNAQSFVNLGLAMSDALANLTQPPCPSRIAAVGGSNGVTLTWQNGSALPTDVRILRNGTEISASSPSDPASFLDANAEPGVLNYEVQFNMPTTPCPPLIVTINTGITNLRTYRSTGGINLTWKNNLGYSAIEVSRDDVVLEAALLGTATSFIDANAPATGSVVYRVRPVNGASLAAGFRMHLGGPRPGEAAIYEPFDYIVGALNNQVGSPTGLTGKWFGNKYAAVAIGSESYSTLPVSGGRLIRSSQRSTSKGDSRPISPSALADRGLLNDGATLWFSFITGYETGANRINTSLSVALAANAFGETSQGNRGTFVAGGTGVGFYFNRGIPRAAFFPADSGTFTGATNSTPEYNVPHLGFIVGRLIWGDSPADPDTIQLFEVGPDLTLPASPISTLAVTVDQTSYDTLAIRQGSRTILDEIRFGASYASVIDLRPSAYSDWASGFTGLNETTTDTDFDHGGLDNVIEWVFGGDPTNGVDDVLLTPTLEKQSDPDFFTYSYRRSDLVAADENTTVSVEYSSNLTGWTEAVPGDDVIVSISNEGVPSGIDLVEVKLRRTLQTDGFFFVRLRVIISE